MPFLTEPALVPPFIDLQGGLDSLDAYTGRLRMRIVLPKPLPMRAADADGLRGEFLTIDENGQRSFALTGFGLSVIQLARVPLGIGTIAPPSGPAPG